MKVYLNAGFGEPLPQADFEQLKHLGFAGIRTDILDNGLADACAAEVKSAGVEAIFLVKSDQIHLAVDATRAHQLSGVVVEVENEPNYTAVSPETLAARINAAAAANPDIQFVSGGVAFWESGGRDYLGRMIAAGLADSAITGFHAYRTTPATTPLPGFASRAAEFAELRRIAPGRRYWHTEVGWHTARRCTLQIGPFCFRSEQLSDTQVRDYWADELQINQDNGVEVVVCYQLNDGPSTAAADRFGIRRLDGSEKPVAAVFAPYAPPAPQPIPTPTPRPGIFWIGTTDFRLPQLQMAGEHDRFKAIIDQRLACGFRLFRVLGMKFNNTGWELNPDGRPEFFTSDIPRFFDYMGSRNAQVEWNIYADTLHLPGWADPNKQMDFYFRSNEALRAYAAFTFVSLGNEVLHTGHQQLNGVSRFPKPEGLRFCRGSSLMDSPPVEPLGDYATYGVRRDALPDARGAGNYSPYGFRAVYPQPVPLIPSEGMKPENYGFDPGFARLIGLHARCGWGGIFHHGRGINGELFTAEEEACARAFVEGLAE
jgi:hypothetical protein